MSPAIQLVVLLLLACGIVLLLLRKTPPVEPDPRVALLSEQVSRLADQITRSDARLDLLASTMRDGLAELRAQASDDATRLRTEITTGIATLGGELQTRLVEVRTDNAAHSNALSTSIRQQFEAITQGLRNFMHDANEGQVAGRESVNAKLTDLGAQNSTNLDRIRATVEDRLDKLNVTNAAKLEEMRVTVDEKLHATLQTRLTESFGQVTDQLNKVHSGLGEMSKLSAGVDDLSRIFTNVKSRGGFAEVQLGMLLEQMLAPSQFLRNARVKPGSQEVVEFAVRFPGHSGSELLLPIDAKFPREDWERLETAYEAGSADEIQAAGKSFEAAIRTEGKRICEKYIQPPVTTPHAIMFLPTEGLYAEVMRREGLQAELQSKCKVTIAGPSTLSAILTSFQMGFALIAFQKKGDEVWKVLGSTKGEFEKFGNLMVKMEKQVDTVQKTMQDLNTRTRAITRTLRDVTTDPGDVPQLGLEDLSAIAPLLAASADED